MATANIVTTANARVRGLGRNFDLGRASHARSTIVATCAAVLAILMVFASSTSVSAATYPILDDPVDPYSNAAPSVCSNGYVYPGVYAFRDILASSYGARTASLARSCPATMTTYSSYHARGLALDWRLSAYNGTEAAYAQQILNWLFQPNSEGDNHVRLRRLGIIEVIWNDRMWTRFDREATSNIQTWRVYDYSGCVAGGGNPDTCAHRDHIHFSFSLEGGNMQRSWWFTEMTPYRDSPTTGPIPERFYPEVARIGGISRYHTAVEVSKEYFPSGASTVYVAAGTNFPDALSAAPAAASIDAPLLLIEPTGVPEVVWEELVRLDPDQILLIGGPAVLSETVEAQLNTLATVSRLSGSDRYETSNSVVRDAFEDSGSSVAYVASGNNFPDALSASAAAGSLNAPVILVDGLATTLRPDTVQLLQDLGVSEVRIAGGPVAVHPDLEAALTTVPGVSVVTRLGGANRWVVSSAINRAAFEDAETVLVASGFNFPDALAGAAVAGARGAPLYVIPTTCVPAQVLDDFDVFGTTNMVVLGGTSSITAAAAAFAPC